MAECRYDNVAIGFRGRFSFEVTVHGVAAHASHYPKVGENALISAGRLASAIEALPTLSHPNLKHGTWCVRYMEGETPELWLYQTVATSLWTAMWFPARMRRPVSARWRDIVKSLGLEGKVDIRLKPRSSPYMKSFSLEPTDPLVTTLQSKFKAVTGEDLPVAYDPSVCDSNILAVSLGIPTVTFGPPVVACTLPTSTASPGR